MRNPGTSKIYNMKNLSVTAFYQILVNLTYIKIKNTIMYCEYCLGNSETFFINLKTLADIPFFHKIQYIQYILI